MKLMVDPPSGWKYGFPKEFDSSRDGEIMDWLIQQGYPQEEKDKLGEHFHVRCWASNTKEESEFKKGVFLAEGKQ